MAMEGRTIPPAHKECRDIAFSECKLVGEAADASHLPVVGRDAGSLAQDQS